MRHVITASNMPAAKVAALAKGKSVRLTPANFTDEGYTSVTIEVADLKAYRRIHAAIDRGKGITLTPSMVKDAVVQGPGGAATMSDVRGGSVSAAQLRRMTAMRAPEPLEQAIVSQHAQTTAVRRAVRKTAVEGDTVGGTVSSIGLTQRGGSLKSIGRKMKKGFVQLGDKLKPAVPVLKDVGLTVAQHAAPVVGAVAEEGTAAAVTYLTGNAAIGKATGKVAGKVSEDQYNKNAAPAAKKERQRGGGLPHGVAPPLSLMASTQSERMAWVRAHRKAAAGGSMRPLGDSMQPLGGSMLPLGQQRR